jgi:tRNA nucleotidyltransferase (CCA-adding enzyme)
VSFFIEKAFMHIHRGDGLYFNYLNTFFRRVLAEAAALAHQQHSPLWLVGGVVRDLLLGSTTMRDLDIAVQGDSVALARALAAALDGRVLAQHQAFGTATVEFARPAADDHEPVTITLDLAATRRESYPHPAALPVVEPAGIEQDLFRRDFSINAMALPVLVSAEGVRFGNLLDPFDGRHDLAAGVLRVLHADSFVDDPTRILRGLRLAARLGFPFEPHSKTLLAEALAGGSLEATSPDRVRAELCLALEEPDPAAVLQRAAAWQIIPHIFAPLEQAVASSQQADIAALAGPLLRAGAITYDLTMEEREALIARYRLPNDAARLLREVGKLRALLAELQRPELRNSELDHILRPFGSSALYVVGYRESGLASQRIQHYTQELRALSPALDGHALQQLGVPPGPRIGALLAGLRAARLDGLVTTRADEEAWVQQHIDD